MRGFTQTHYCADAKCEGFEGFEVKWAPDTMTDPAYPLTDTCPTCGAGMLDEPVAYEDAIAGLLDELQEGGAIGETNLHEVNERELLAAIQRELQRQVRDAWKAEYGLLGLTPAQERARIDQLVEEGILPF